LLIDPLAHALAAKGFVEPARGLVLAQLAAEMARRSRWRAMSASSVPPKPQRCQDRKT
jgi:hypothetical protein